MQLKNKVYPALYIVICPFIIYVSLLRLRFLLWKKYVKTLSVMWLFTRTLGTAVISFARTTGRQHALMHFNSTYLNHCLHTCKCFDESANQWKASCSAVRTVVRPCKACRAITRTWPLPSSFATIRISKMRVCSRKDFMGSRRLKLPTYISNEMSVHYRNDNNYRKL